MKNTIRKNKPQGLLIAVEGIDGSGKSTFCKTLAALLHQHNKSVFVTKEPGATPLGVHIRQLLMHRENPLDHRAEFLLFAADRAQHFSTIIIPSLAVHDFVISDRMADSSIVYQGYGHDLDLSMLSTVNNWAMYNRQPDIVFYLALPAKIAQERMIVRNKPFTDFEKDFEKLQQAERHFEQHFQNNPNVCKLNAQEPTDAITLQALSHITTFIAQ